MADAESSSTIETAAVVSSDMVESEDHPQTNSLRTNESTSSVGEKSRAEDKLPEGGATDEETPCASTLDRSQTPVSAAVHVESEGTVTGDNNPKSSTESADSSAVSASEMSTKETTSRDVEVGMEMTDSDTNDSQSRGSAQKETQDVASHKTLSLAEVLSSPTAASSIMSAALNAGKPDTDEESISFTCPTCSAQFQSEEDLARHKLSHNRSHACARCQKTFTAERSLQMHYKMIHKEDWKPPESADPPKSDSMELNSAPPDSEPPAPVFSCPQCDSQFSDGPTFEAHFRTHFNSNEEADKSAEKPPPISMPPKTPDRAHECPYCTYSGDYLDSLAQHVNYHRRQAIKDNKGLSKKATLKCRHCSYKPNSHRELLGHVQAVHGINDKEIEMKGYCLTCLGVAKGYKPNPHCPTCVINQKAVQDRWKERLKGNAHAPMIGDIICDGKQNGNEGERGDNEECDGVQNMSGGDDEPIFGETLQSKNDNQNSDQIENNDAQSPVANGPIPIEIIPVDDDDDDSNDVLETPFTPQTNNKPTDSPAIPCPFCKSTFITHSEVAGHIIQSHGKESSTQASTCCLICGQKHKTTLELLMHIKTHENKRRADPPRQPATYKPLYSCPKCIMSFSSLAYYGVHLATHREIVLGALQCPIDNCNQALTENTYLYLAFHVVEAHCMEKGNIQERCPICAQPCATDGLVALHMIGEHIYKGDTLQPLYPCHNCSAVKLSHHILGGHMTGCSAPATYPYSCPRCHGGFRLERNFELHKISCRRDKCPPPEKTSSRSLPIGSLARTVNAMHEGTGIRCTQCGLLFNVRSTFDAHLKTCVSGLQKCNCVFCGNTYDFPGPFQQHVTQCSMNPYRNQVMLPQNMGQPLTNGQIAMPQMIGAAQANGPVMMPQNRIPQRSPAKRPSSSAPHQHPCTYCSEVFKTDRGLSCHMKFAHNIEATSTASSSAQVYQCSECNFSFADEERLNDHVRFFHQSNSLVNFQQGQPNVLTASTGAPVLPLSRGGKVDENRNINPAARLFDRVGETDYYTCMLCLVSIHTKFTLIQHLVTTHGIESFENTVHSNHVDHNVVKALVEKFKADPEAAPRLENLTSVILHKCRKCKRGYSSKRSLRTHIVHQRNTSYHKCLPIITKGFICPVMKCDHSYDSAEQFRAHYEVHQIENSNNLPSFVELLTQGYLDEFDPKTAEAEYGPGQPGEFDSRKKDENSEMSEEMSNEEILAMSQSMVEQSKALYEASVKQAGENGSAHLKDANKMGLRKRGSSTESMDSDDIKIEQKRSLKKSRKQRTSRERPAVTKQEKPFPETPAVAKQKPFNEIPAAAMREAMNKAMKLEGNMKPKSIVKSSVKSRACPRNLYGTMRKLAKKEIYLTIDEDTYEKCRAKCLSVMVEKKKFLMCGVCKYYFENQAAIHNHMQEKHEVGNRFIELR